MTTNNDANEISKAVKELKLNELFDTDKLSMSILNFEKSEIIIGPIKPVTSLMFCVSGTGKIYDLGQSANIAPIYLVSKGDLLGDMEFGEETTTSFYVEAMEKCQFLSIPFDKNREILLEDNRFLRFLLKELIHKHLMRDSPALSLEERLFILMRNSDNEINGVEQAAIKLQCSRRQLQRILHKCCEDGRIIKCGKGKYKLSEKQ